MSGLSRNQLVACALALLVVVFAARALARDRDDRATPALTAPPVTLERGEEAGGRATVHVAGAVRRPGVYRLHAGARVDDAVRRAGGPARRADLAGLNLAAKVEDGRQVLVPERVRAAGGRTDGAAAISAEAAADMPLNLNTATAEQLDQLDGVGPATAQKILEYRQDHGGFGSVEELSRIPGIGERRMASLREQVRT